GGKSDCKIEVKAFDTRMDEYKKRIQKIAAKYSNVVVLDTKDTFCDSKFCYAVKNDKMLYADDDHLSVDGSNYQAKYFINRITTQSKKSSNDVNDRKLKALF
ncbi:MAG: hypothetical protein IE880_02905, partial [Epsilonproteobacteria bacterium]|nr:hypothetical protein [Campylobacterota bacterium]